MMSARRLHFAKKSAAVALGFLVIDKNASAFASNFFTVFAAPNTNALFEGHATPDTLTHTKEPCLNGGNHVFEHGLSIQDSASFDYAQDFAVSSR